MPGRMEFKIALPRAGDTQAPLRDSGSPMRLLVLGDFSGKPAATRTPLAQRATHRVDVDNIDDVLRRLATRLEFLAVGAANPAAEIDFSSLDDFHPDRLYAQVNLFRALRDMRARLQDPARFAAAAAELQQTAVLPAIAEAAPAQPAQAATAADLDLLGSLLGKPAGGLQTPPAAAAVAPHAAAGIDALIRGIVAPHIVRDAPPFQAQYLASVDMATGETMRALLHDPAFQSLESAWRGVMWLISSLELDENLELHLFDVSRDELRADVVAAKGQVTMTGLHRALADRWRNTPDGQGWTVLAGLYSFGPSDADIGLLAALGLIASQAGGPLLAAGDTALAGDDAKALAGWNALRRSEAAPWIGLAAPRVLLRLPYGKGSDPIAAFAFEEMPGTPEHEGFLWGNGSLAVALLIGRAFTAAGGWDFEPGDEREIGDLPAFTFLQGGERELQACAEQYLGEQGGNALLAAGLMPVMSHRHANAVTVMRFQSVAEPAAALAGPTRVA